MLRMPGTHDRLEVKAVGGYAGPIVDVDIHHCWFDREEVIKYMPRRWQNYMKETRAPIDPPYHNYTMSNNGAWLLETLDAGLTGDRTGTAGGGTDEAKLRSMLVDKYNYSRCMLDFNVGSFGGHLNPELAVAVCRAVNDWNIDYWLSRDDRYYSVVVIPSGQPEAAAAEIRRVGKHPRVVSVLHAGNLLGRPFGDPVYNPVHKAAAELGLRISLHWGGWDRPSTSVSVVGGHLFSGTFTNSQFSQQAMHYISSYISNGTFEKYPGLRILVLEYGVAWLPYLMTRLDNDYQLMKAESTWVKKWPSDYIRSNIKLGTQPVDESPDPRQLIELLETIDGVEDLLCFSSDWPHWTADDPAETTRRLPKAWHRKVMCDNACEFFGWARPVDVPALAGVRT
jgi:hypothetical protein